METTKDKKFFIDPSEITRLKSGVFVPKSFADISDGTDFGPIPGRKIRLSEVLGRDIIITGFQSVPSRKKQDARCITIQFLMDGELRILWTGSVVLERLLCKYIEKIPFRTKIQRCNEAFVLE